MRCSTLEMQLHSLGCPEHHHKFVVAPHTAPSSSGAWEAVHSTSAWPVSSLNMCRAAAKRQVTVAFAAEVQPGLKWSFKPAQKSIKIRPGQSTLVFYTAENLSDDHITAVSTYNVAPPQVLSQHPAVFIIHAHMQLMSLPAICVPWMMACIHSTVDEPLLIRTLLSRML